MWTAPVYFNVRCTGLGITLGYATIDSFLLMDSEEPLDAYCKTQLCCPQVAAGDLAGTQTLAMIGNVTFASCVSATDEVLESQHGQQR